MNCNGVGYHVWNDCTPDCVICKGSGMDNEYVDLVDAIKDCITTNKLYPLISYREMKNESN